MYDFSETYRNFLKSKLPLAKDASGKSEIVTRCMYCSDSKDPKKGHFYISIPKREDEPSYFYCQKCQSFGVVTSKKLIEWGLYDPDISIVLNKYNSKVFNTGNTKLKNKILGSDIYYIKQTKITDDKLSRYKLNYINKRLGTNLTYDDCLKEKIVLNLSDIMEENHLKPTRNENIINSLDNGFVGFLSYDNAFLNMRNMDIIKDLYKGIDKRYINYNLIDKIDNTQRFYIIPTNIDIMNPNPIKIHIAEGPFDILSIYHNVRHDHDNSIFAAIGGKRYLGIIKYFINVMKLVNIEIHLYLDKDIENWLVDKIKDVLYPFFINIYIHRNMYPGEKDFGVPLSRIDEKITY